MQKNKELKVKIEVLNKFDIVVDYIEGITLSGSVDIKNDGLTRRSLSLTFVANSKTEITPNSRLWINRRVRVFIGILNYSNEVEYFNLGIFVISNPEKSTTNSGTTISIKGYDKGSLFKEELGIYTVFSANTPVVEAIKALGGLIGENKFLLENTGYVIPYEMKLQGETAIEKAMKDLNDMYMSYQIYYNLDGYLVYEKMQNRLNDPIIWSFKDSLDFHLNKTKTYNYDDVKNNISVIGNLDEKTGVQPRYVATVTGLDKPFSIDNIGKRSNTFAMDKYSTDEQCKQKALYELEKAQNLANTITINTIPIYLINDVNKIIEVYDYDIDETEKYLIDSVSIPLNVDGQMNIVGHKLFN
jgi:hypothetical protein